MRKPLHSTKYIKLDTHKCVGCFNCIEACNKNVMGKINFLWHKHVLIKRANDCVGCYRCVGVCKDGALTRI